MTALRLARRPGLGAAVALGANRDPRVIKLASRIVIPKAITKNTGFVSNLKIKLAERLLERRDILDQHVSREKIRIKEVKFIDENGRRKVTEFLVGGHWIKFEKEKVEE
jgi:hypothetical protein